VRRGFTLLELMIVVAIIAVLASLSLPNMLESRKRANEVAAIGQLRTYLAEDLRGAILPNGTQSGYTFTVFSLDEYDWFVNADPQQPGKSGERYFYVDRSGTIRFSTTGPAGVSSTAIGVGQ
jgi:prepilin-type N-terminal cleavage/methylation domain-containing protein